jgi:hypothetical protein
VRYCSNRRPAGILQIGKRPRWGSAAEPDAYVNRQYQYARRPAPARALDSKVGSAWLDIWEDL